MLLAVLSLSRIAPPPLGILAFVALRRFFWSNMRCNKANYFVDQAEHNTGKPADRDQYTQDCSLLITHSIPQASFSISKASRIAAAYVLKVLHS